MRTLFLAVAALSLATGGQALAQPGHEEHHPLAPTAAADPTPPTHEDCKTVMGRKMDDKGMHNHSADKGAPVAGPTKPLSKAEMEKMHARCAAKMAEADEVLKK